MEKLRKHVEKKRKLALEFRDMGKSLQIRSAEAAAIERNSSAGNRNAKDSGQKKVFFAKTSQRVSALTIG